jgi:hypothetical protein
MKQFFDGVCAETPAKYAESLHEQEAKRQQANSKYDCFEQAQNDY